MNIPRPFSLALVLCMMLQHIYAQSTDSLKQELARTTQDSIKVSILLEIAESNIRSNTDSFYYYSQRALDLGIKLNLGSGIKKSAANIAYYFRYDGNYDSALLYYDLSLQNHFPSDPKLPNTLYSIGNVYKAMDNFTEANAYYLKSLMVSDEQENATGKAVANLGLGSLQLAQKEVSQAIEFFKRALQNFESVSDTRGVYISINNLGTALFELGDFRVAKPYFLRAKEAAKQLQDVRGLSDIYSNLGLIYEEEKNYDSAFILHKESLSIRKRLNIKDGIIKSYHNIASVNISRRSLKLAENYLDSAYTLIEELDSDVEYKYYWNYKIKLDTALRRFESATHSIFEYMKYKGRVEDNELKAEIAELQTKYETEKKDQKIENLSQQSKIQALEISQRNTLLFTGGILLIILVLGGYFYQKQRQLSHQQAVKNIEQRMLRLQMNPHFIFNALASIQNYILQSDTKESVSYLAKFGKLMRQILEHSREEFIPITEEVDMLHNYLQIQQLRFKNRFEYEINVAETINSDQTKIPPLFAQPFVENAIEHGLKDKTDGGLITVNFELHDSQLMLEIKDNGSGIHIPTDAKTGHKSLATQITKERLLLLSERFKINFSMNINENSQNSGVVTRLVLPVSSIR